MKGLVLIAVVLLSAGVAWLGNWLALIPWRRAKGMHWTERARVYFPVRIAAHTNLLLIPIGAFLITLFFQASSSPHWILVGIAGAVGTLIGTVPMDHEVFPRVPLPDLWRQVLTTFVMRFLVWIVFAAAIVLMPTDFNAFGFALAGLILILWFVWSHQGWITVAGWIGLLSPPPERLQRIVTETAGRMNVQVRDVRLLRISFAQAYALPSSKKLLFTDRLLELLSDEELAGICAHELGHLKESKLDQMKRHVRVLAFWPLIFLGPLSHRFGPPAYLALVVNAALIPLLYQKISQRLEQLADALAKGDETDPGNYARALEKLYEDNLLPAVTASQKTHPHLYDRMLAAGVTPSYPRPAASKAMAWNGQILPIIIGLYVGFSFIQKTSTRDDVSPALEPEMEEQATAEQTAQSPPLLPGSSSNLLNWTNPPTH